MRLRATRAPLDLHGLGSAIPDGLALPFVLRGRPQGLAVCGPRAGGRYAREEVEFLARVADEIGTALFALRAEANETELLRLRRALSAPSPPSG